jgi:hypothetical protein
MRNLLIAACLGIYVDLAYATAYKDVDVELYGETNLSRGATAELKTSLNFAVEVPVFEPSHRKWVLVLTSVINPEVDHFQNEVRVNVFTVLGMHF